MKNHFSILAGILLAASVFAQEIEEADIADAGRNTTTIESGANVSTKTENIAAIPVVEEKLKLDTATEPFVKTEYVIDTPEENNGFCGGIGFGIYSFDMSPVRRLISNRETEELTDTSNSLHIFDYEFLRKVGKSEAVPTFRMMFYGINETKFHIGGVFEFGGRTWQIQNTAKDSVVMMGFAVAKLGLLMEQVVVHNDKNYLAFGATIGGGATGVGFFSRKGSKSSFVSTSDDNSQNIRSCYDDKNKWNYCDDSDDGIFGKKKLGAASGFVYLDVNLAYILSVSKRLHLRFDAICDIMGSKSGYNLAGDDYGIVNPGGAFSLIWGSKQ